MFESAPISSCSSANFFPEFLHRSARRLQKHLFRVRHHAGFIGKHAFRRFLERRTARISSASFMAAGISASCPPIARFISI